MGQLSAYTYSHTAGNKAKAPHVTQNLNDIKDAHNATDAELPTYTSGSRVIASNSGKTAMEETSVTTTTLSYLDATSSIQTQLDTCIHDNTSGEIAALSEKTALVAADLVIIEDSEASNAKKKAQIGILATKEICIAASDETTDIATGTAKTTFRMPYAMTVTDVRASVNTAPVGSTITVDINESGTTILSTKLTIDSGETTSETAATPAVISDSTLADDAEMTIDVDQVGSSTAGKGLKIWLIGTKA